MRKTRELLAHFGIAYDIPDNEDSFKQYSTIDFPLNKVKIVFDTTPEAELKASKNAFKTRTRA